MRGLPWLRLVSIVAVFAVLGWPVWRLTRPLPSSRPGVPPTAEAGTPATILLALELSFAGPPPASFQIKQATRVILQGDGSGVSEFRTEWNTPLPKEGLDLTLQASWPAAGPAAAVRLNVGLPDGRQIQKLFWPGESLVEIITVPGTDGENS